MNLDKLIEQLERMRAKHGNADVFCDDYDVIRVEYDDMDDTVNLII